MNNKNTVLILALVIALILSIFGAFADPGDSNDPLVSKSYVDAQIAAVKAESSGSYTIVHVSAGQKVIGMEGTEIIVRAGAAKVIDNGVNGVSDLTYGDELMSGETARPNHLIVIPRNDGRGVKAVTEAYLMIRGGYTLKK